MKQFLMLALASILCACNGNTNQKPEEVIVKPVKQAGNKSDNVIAELETDDYLLKVHEVIPFVSSQSEGFVPKQGNHYVALDISVTNKSDAPLDMSVIMTSVRITDLKGNIYSDTLGAITAYGMLHPEQDNEKGFASIWNEKFPAKVTHRAVAIGFQAPREIKAFKLTASKSDDLQNLDQTRSIEFSIQ